MRSHIGAGFSTNADALSRIGSVSKEDDLSDEFDEDRKKKSLYEFHDSCRRP